MNRLYPLGAALLAAICISAAHAEPAPHDGATVYEQHCARCHNPGFSSLMYRAPRIGTPFWSQRLAAVGKDALIKHTINGIGRMPAQGGPDKLGDAQIGAAVVHLLGDQPDGSITETSER